MNGETERGEVSRSWIRINCNSLRCGGSCGKESKEGLGGNEGIKTCKKGPGPEKNPTVTCGRRELCPVGARN